MLCQIMDAVRNRVLVTSFLTGKRIDVNKSPRNLVPCVAIAAIGGLLDEPRPQLSVNLDNIAFFPCLDFPDKFWITGDDDRVIAFHVSAPVPDFAYTAGDGNVDHGVDIVAAILNDLRRLDDGAEHIGKAHLR